MKNVKHDNVTLKSQTTSVTVPRVINVRHLQCNSLITFQWDLLTVNKRTNWINVDRSNIFSIVNWNQSKFINSWKVSESWRTNTESIKERLNINDWLLSDIWLGRSTPFCSFQQNQSPVNIYSRCVLFDKNSMINLCQVLQVWIQRSCYFLNRTSHRRKRSLIRKYFLIEV